MLDDARSAPGVQEIGRMDRFRAAQPGSQRNAIAHRLFRPISLKCASPPYRNFDTMLGFIKERQRQPTQGFKVSRWSKLKRRRIR